MELENIIKEKAIRDEFYSKTAEFSQDGGSPVEAYAMQGIADYFLSKFNSILQEIDEKIGEDEELSSIAHIMEASEVEKLEEEIAVINKERQRIRAIIRNYIEK